METSSDPSDGDADGRRTLRTIALIRARAPGVLDGATRVFAEAEDAGAAEAAEAAPLDEADAFLQRFLRTRAWAGAGEAGPEGSDASASERQLEAQDRYEDAYNRGDADEVRHVLSYARGAFETARERRSRRAEQRRRRQQRRRDEDAEHARFRYTPVAPESLGLSPAEILLASDDELARREREQRRGRSDARRRR